MGNQNRMTVVKHFVKQRKLHDAQWHMKEKATKMQRQLTDGRPKKKRASKSRRRPLQVVDRKQGWEGCSGCWLAVCLAVLVGWLVLALLAWLVGWVAGWLNPPTPGPKPRGPQNRGKWEGACCCCCCCCCCCWWWWWWWWRWYFGWILGYLGVIFGGSWGDLGGILGHIGGILGDLT